MLCIIDGLVVDHWSCAEEILDWSPGSWVMQWFVPSLQSSLLWLRTGLIKHQQAVEAKAAAATAESCVMERLRYGPYRPPYRLPTTGPDVVACLLVSCGFCILATAKVTPTWAVTCAKTHSWTLYSAAPLENRAISIMTWYPTQSHYPDIEATSPCPVLIRPNTWLGSDNYNLISHWFESTMGSSPRSPKGENGALPIRSL